MIRWDSSLWLLTLDEFNQLPDGTILRSITGKRYTKGADNIDIDIDTRFEHLYYGIDDPATHELAELFTVFKLKA